MKLFDFLIVPVYRAGGTAIQSFISAHPGIVAVPKWRLDNCLEENQEGKLLESFQDLMLSNPNARVGLVQHRYIGEHENLDSIAERLSRIVRKDGLIMVFRNPFDAVLSGMNHRRITQYCDYSFPKAGLFWPDRMELGRGVRPFLDAVDGASCEPDEPTGRVSDELAFVSEQALRYVQYAEIQETFERYFSRATLFDYDDILAPNNRSGMNALFAALRADRDFYLPFFAASQAGTADRFLSHNGITIFSPHVPERTVVLRPVTMNNNAVFDKGTCIGRIYDGYIQNLFSEELCLVTAPPLKASEVGQGQIDTFLRGFFYPLWRKNHEIVSRVIDGFRLNSLPKELRSIVKERLAPDAARFMEGNRNLGDAWRESWESA